MYLWPDLNKIAELGPWKHHEIQSPSKTGIKRSYQLVLPAVSQQARSHAVSDD